MIVADDTYGVTANPFWSNAWEVQAATRDDDHHRAARALAELDVRDLRAGRAAQGHVGYTNERHA